MSSYEKIMLIISIISLICELSNTYTNMIL